MVRRGPRCVVWRVLAPVPVRSVQQDPTTGVAASAARRR